MSSSTPPNIVYLHAHDTGRYVQPYGYPVSTPAIQRLAEGGVVFRQAFAAAPTCSPSRAALLTGETPHQTGMLGLAHRGFRLRHPDRHLAAFLRGSGYETILTGMQHLEEGDQGNVGYSRDLRPERLNVADVAPIAVDVIEDWPDDGAPFFLDIGFEETHRPYPEPRDDPRWLRPPATIPDTPETREDIAGFRASAAELDRGVAMVLEAIERRGLTGQTIVICTTDHGLPFPGMKGTLTDHGIGVFLILSAPGRGFEGGKVIDTMVSHLDIFPTLCDLLGIDHPEWLQGQSLVPLVAGEIATVHDELFGEVTFHATYEPTRSIRTPRWRYVRRFGEHDLPVLANVDESPSRDVWLEHDWVSRRTAREELYDVVHDPAQRHSLAGDEAYAGVMVDLRSRLEAWMRLTDDPLLEGDVPLPEGARMNRIDARSADEELIEGDQTG